MLTIDHCRRAYAHLKGRVAHTPTIRSLSFSTMFGASIYLKLENLQHTGSFKLRGATYKLKVDAEGINGNGIVAASAGNHAQGVALAARNAGIPATIVMPEWVSISKQEATRGYGGKIVIHGRNVEESLGRARELEQSGLHFIHPFDDPDIIAGQGSIGFEILEDLPDVDTVVVPVGGGGLISGIASVLKTVNASIRLIGVQSSACPSGHAVFKKKDSRVVDAERSVADGISVKRIGDLPHQIINDRVDDMVLVEEDHITHAMLTLLERKKLIVEGAGAVPLAALISGAIRAAPGEKVVLVLSGGNVDSPLLGRMISQGLIRKGRIMRIRIILDDVPGALARLLDIVARQKANVLHIHHDRHLGDLPLHLTSVTLELETRSADHALDVVDAIQTSGYTVERCDGI